MSILGAESYLDGNTLFVAQSLADLAHQQMDAPQVSQVAGMGYTFEMTRQRAVTPEALNARTVSGVERRVSGGEHDRTDSKGKASQAPDAKSPEPESQAGKKKRKRKTDQDDHEEVEDESGKKSRGRPRLETKDETAADVRARLSIIQAFLSVVSLTMLQLQTPLLLLVYLLLLCLAMFLLLEQ